MQIVCDAFQATQSQEIHHSVRDIVHRHNSGGGAVYTLIINNTTSFTYAEVLQGNWSLIMFTFVLTGISKVLL